MIVSKAVVFAVFLMAVLNIASAKPRPSIIRERHIIRAPIKFKVIHHYKIKKVPIIIKKHLHYHKPNSQQLEPLLEEIHANHVHQDDSNDSEELFSHTGFGGVRDEGKAYAGYAGLRDDRKKKNSFSTAAASPQENDHDSQEDDYEDEQESQEDYDDSEYE